MTSGSPTLRFGIRPGLGSRALLLVVAVGCGRIGYDPIGDGGGGNGTDGLDRLDGPLLDGSRAFDASPNDAVGGDGGAAADAGSPVDGGVPADAGSPVDGGVAADGGSPVDGGVTADAGSTPNLVFATSTTYRGDFGGLAYADAECNARAVVAGLPGTYVAWLSTATTLAPDRLAGSRGWMRVDGKPVADTVAEMAFGLRWYPIDIDENGARVATDSYVWSGTTASGGAFAVGDNCRDWRRSSEVATVGRASSTALSFTSGITVNCNYIEPFLCFGIGNSVAVTSPATAGRLAFVATNWVSGGGIADADATCQADATAAGLPGTYLAWLTTSTTAASARMASSGLPWVRVDGLPIANSLAELVADDFELPLCLTASGALITDPTDVYLGDATSNCLDWTTASNLELGALQNLMRAPYLTSTGAHSCNHPTTAIYCFEQ